MKNHNYKFSNPIFSGFSMMFDDFTTWQAMVPGEAREIFSFGARKSECLRVARAVSPSSDGVRSRPWALSLRP